MSLTMVLKFVPVSLKKRWNMLICRTKTMIASKSSSKESMIRSVTTVPRDFENDVPSYFVKIPQRTTSPDLGMIKLVVYDMNIA